MQASSPSFPQTADGRMSIFMAGLLAVLNLATCFLFKNSSNIQFPHPLPKKAYFVFALLVCLRLQESCLLPNTYSAPHSCHLCYSLTLAHPYSVNDPWTGFANIGRLPLSPLLADQIDNPIRPESLHFLIFGDTIIQKKRGREKEIQHKRERERELFNRRAPIFIKVKKRSPPRPRRPARLSQMGSFSHSRT